MVNNTYWSRRKFMSGCLAGSAALALPLSTATPEETSPWVGSIPAGPNGKLRILCITDLHFFCLTEFFDQLTIRTLHKMVDRFSPDLIIATGDVWHNNPDHRGLEFCRFFVKTMTGLGVPWAYARGNHDLADDFGKCEQMIATAENSLYRGSTTGGHYRLEVKDQAGRPLWNLIFIDDAHPKMGFNQEDADWLLAEAGRIQESCATPPALLFCHIPILAYNEMFKAGKARGIKHEKVCCESCQSDAMAAILDTGMVRAMFCGHDHMNDFEGDWQGVHLEYLRATGYAGYGGEWVRKGAAIIETAADGSFITETVFPYGPAWRPRRKVFAGLDRL